MSASIHMVVSDCSGTPIMSRMIVAPSVFLAVETFLTKNVIAFAPDSFIQFLFKAASLTPMLFPRIGMSYEEVSDGFHLIVTIISD